MSDFPTNAPAGAADPAAATTPATGTAPATSSARWSREYPTG
ncbi:hypothetical protein [Cellulosimicrobium sp. CUA-896]|nr:hypothetical protein [Cellulosimicrobium sp. CUA-896]